MGMVVLRRFYPRHKYAAVVLVTLGIILSTIASQVGVPVRPPPPSERAMLAAGVSSPVMSTVSSTESDSGPCNPVGA